MDPNLRILAACMLLAPSFDRWGGAKVRSQIDDALSLVDALCARIDGRAPSPTREPASVPQQAQSHMPVTQPQHVEAPPFNNPSMAHLNPPAPQ